jgi:hypothetical protein
MGSGAVIYVPSFIKIGSGVQKVIGGIHRQQGDLISLLLFFLNKESRLRNKIEFIYSLNLQVYEFGEYPNGSEYAPNSVCCCLGRSA